MASNTLTIYQNMIKYVKIQNVKICQMCINIHQHQGIAKLRHFGQV